MIEGAERQIRRAMTFSTHVRLPSKLEGNMFCAITSDLFPRPQFVPLSSWTPSVIGGGGSSLSGHAW
jgi:hypothetical protein